MYQPSRQSFYPPSSQAKFVPDEISLQTSDGEKLWAWHFHPKTKEKGVFLFFHGNAENLTSHYLALSWILEKGYGYVIFDYRGYGKSSGNPSPKGTVLDGEAAWEYTSQYAAQKKIPLYLFAQSLGGPIALRSFYEFHRKTPVLPLPKWMVLDSTFLSYQAAGNRVLRNFIVTWPFQWLSYLLLSDRWAPNDESLASLSGIPKLVIHGTADRAVAYALGEKLFQKIPEPKTFWKIENGQHIDALWREDGKYRAAFLKELELRK